jgi:hypothetical protein
MTNNETNTVQAKSFKCSKRSIVFYKQLRPCLLKLFTHFVLLYISIRSFYLFVDSNTSYSDFLGNMRSPVILDLKMINADEDCPAGYSQMTGSGFPRVNSGCRCDYGIYTKDVCEEFQKGLSGTDVDFAYNCKLQDSAQSTRLLQQIIQPTDTQSGNVGTQTGNVGTQTGTQNTPTGTQNTQTGTQNTQNSDQSGQTSQTGQIPQVSSGQTNNTIQNSQNNTTTNSIDENPQNSTDPQTTVTTNQTGTQLDDASTQITTEVPRYYNTRKFSLINRNTIFLQMLPKHNTRTKTSRPQILD